VQDLHLLEDCQLAALASASDQQAQARKSDKTPNQNRYPAGGT
jgi:hypothetical protein